MSGVGEHRPWATSKMFPPRHTGRFLLLVEPGDGPVWLEVTGPEGTESFLDTLLDTPPATAGGA